jgi:hypothetical protein
MHVNRTKDGIVEDDAEDRQELTGLENKDSQYYWANKERRTFLHIRSVSYSCRTRDKSENHSREFASNIRAFLLDDLGFKPVLDKTEKDISETDEKFIFKQVYLLLGGNIKKFEALPKHEKDDQRAKVAVYILSSTPEERSAWLCLDTPVSCKLRGYEKESFVLKAWTLGLRSFRVARCCYHAIYPPEFTEPIDFDDLLGMIKFSPKQPAGASK